MTFDIGRKADFSETRVESKSVYDGKILNLRVDRVRLTDGRLVSREVVEHRPAVVILAENDDESVALVRQYRYAAGETLFELPAGLAEPSEDIAESAVRELREEVGLRPSRVEKVAEFYTSPGFTDEIISMFYATGLSPDRLPLDDDELLVAGFASRGEIEDLLRAGSIKDCKTLFGLHWWLNKLNARS
ncbi:MAG: NUDIX hydrolase [Synergistaceae bacterium]|jgi:ADP-ribose pyrophosphatase|nr:NUDIX hydrolase [Synergistaceae bacterium]